MKSIVIIDNKIDIDNEINIQNLLEKFNNDIKWIVKKSVPSDFNGTTHTILFIHINNKKAVAFIKDYCEMFQNIYITSTSPSTEQLRKIQNCDKVKLFDFPILNETTWKSLDWSSAISRWENGEDFPINYLKPKGKTHLIALSILCQGYLAAHWDEIDNEKKESLYELKSLPDEMKKNAQSNKNKTKGHGWWHPAFNNDDLEKKDLKDTRLGMELILLGKACKDSTAIKNLFDVIKLLNGQSFCDTDKVRTAYNCIKKLLQRLKN